MFVACLPYCPSYVPFLADIFSIVPLSLNEWALVLAYSLPVIFIDEVRGHEGAVRCVRVQGAVCLRGGGWQQAHHAPWRLPMPDMLHGWVQAARLKFQTVHYPAPPTLHPSCSSSSGATW